MSTDPKAAAADAKAEKARAKALRPWYKKKRFIIPIALFVLGAIGSATGSGSDSGTTEQVALTTDADEGPTNDLSTNTENPPEKDVDIVGCKIEYGFATVKLRVVNNSSKTSDYYITLGVEDAAGNKTGDGFASTSNVRPGQTANIEGVATTSDEGNTCVLEEVERFAS